MSKLFAKINVGFIGQGFIGKNMADDYEKRGYSVVRYSLDPEYVNNRPKLKACEVIFLAVPTPTTPTGFDLSTVKVALKDVPAGAIAVIKSTIVPGSTQALQKEFPDITVLHSPEFLREKSAAEDTAHPQRNIVGIPEDTPEVRAKAQLVLDSLPPATYSAITSSVNAECIKYVGNTYLYTKMLFMNIAYDFVNSVGGDWEAVRDAVSKDSRIGSSHMTPVYDDGRGAGGHCFPKDFEAFIETFRSLGADGGTLSVLEAMRDKNNQLLVDSAKDLDLLHGIYGEDIPTSKS
jgi:UDPglucose 6-dehydrogenase